MLFNEIFELWLTMFKEIDFLSLLNGDEAVQNSNYIKWRTSWSRVIPPIIILSVGVGFCGVSCDIAYRRRRSRQNNMQSRVRLVPSVRHFGSSHVYQSLPEQTRTTTRMFEKLSTPLQRHRNRMTRYVYYKKTVASKFCWRNFPF